MEQPLISANLRASQSNELPREHLNKEIYSLLTDFSVSEPETRHLLEFLVC